MAVSNVLETARLRLEPFTDAHLTPRYVGWLNDPEVVRFSERRHRPHTADSSRAYLASFQNTLNYFWAIVAIDPGLGHIGNITAHVDSENSLADIGILIGQREVWGKRFGSEAWCAVMAFLADVVGIRKITAGALSTNVGMLQIMRRAGMRDDGVRSRHYVVAGQEIDVVHMAKFNGEDDARS